MSDEASKTSVKDFSNYYHDSIALSLEKIHNWNYKISMSPQYLLYINAEINQIYKKIHRRLSKEESEMQMKYITKLDSLSPVLIDKRYNHEDEEVQAFISRGKDYKLFKQLLFRREVHLWDCLDRLEMTSKKIDKSGLIQ